MIEVIAAITLMATLLVMMLTAFGVQRKQLIESSKKQEAVKQAELLLTGWYSVKDGIPPAPALGLCEPNSGMSWRLVRSRENLPIPLPSLVVNRLAIFELDRPDTELAGCELLQTQAAEQR